MWVILQIRKEGAKRKNALLERECPMSMSSLCFALLEHLSISTLTAKGLQLCGTSPAFPRVMAFIFTGDSCESMLHEQASHPGGEVIKK